MATPSGENTVMTIVTSGLVASAAVLELINWMGGF